MVSRPQRPSVETSLQALDRLYARSQSQAQKSTHNPNVVAASVRVHRSRKLKQKQGHRLTRCECIGSTYALIWVPLQNRASKTQERHALYSQLTSCGPLVLSDCSGVRSNPIPIYTKKTATLLVAPKQIHKRYQAVTSWPVGRPAC